MKTNNEILKFATDLIKNEINALEKLEHSINKDFAMTVQAILKTKGKVIVSGIGKSAIIAHKIASTLSATGSPAFFLHAADAIHGDLGAISKKDILLCVSKSGETKEILSVVDYAKSKSVLVVAFLNNIHSSLAKKSDFVLNTATENEASPNNMIPTSSSTNQMVLGHALAISLFKCKGYSDLDYLKLHPGGVIGELFRLDN